VFATFESLPEVTDTRLQPLADSWKETFNVTTKEDAEARMKEAGMNGNG